MEDSPGGILRWFDRRIEIVGFEVFDLSILSFIESVIIVKLKVSHQRESRRLRKFQIVSEPSED